MTGEPPKLNHNKYNCDLTPLRAIRRWWWRHCLGVKSTEMGGPEKLSAKVHYCLQGMRFFRGCLGKSSLGLWEIYKIRKLFWEGKEKEGSKWIGSTSMENRERRGWQGNGNTCSDSLHGPGDTELLQHHLCFWIQQFIMCVAIRLSIPNAC